MNIKIKFREGFRPFAPSVLRERVSEYFDLDTGSPYMLLVAPVKKERQVPMTPEQQHLWGLALLNVPKSDIPAVTHIDFSARVQTVAAEVNPDYHALLLEFERQTGCAVVVNTSFNVRGEPIVLTPLDAYRCFMRTHIDYLVLGPYILSKESQPEWTEEERWRTELPLDAGLKFALTVGIAFLALGGLGWWRDHVRTAMVFGSLSAVLLVLGLVVPSKLGPVERAWMGMAQRISKITTPIFMGAISFLVVTPLALVMAVVGKRPLRVRSGATYWRSRAVDAQRSDLTRQF